MPDYPTFEVTGVTRNGKRFKQYYSNSFHAYCINLYRGSVWMRKADGTRVLLKRVWN